MPVSLYLSMERTAARHFMATKRRFGIGDEVTLHGIVRLLDAAGPGTVTVEISATGQRMTVQELATGLDLVAKGKADAFTKAPRGRQPRLIPDRE